MNKKKRALVAALVVSGIAVVGLAAVVYAKYISSITKTGTATVAKWAFTTDNTDGGVVTCDPTQTYTAATLDNGKIAPGTSGECQISVSNATSEVGIRYEITPSATGKPTHLKLCADSSCNTEVDSTHPVTGTLAPKAAATPVTIYWVWPYEDNPSTAAYDAIDTTDGTAGSTMTITFDITGIQLQPVAQ